MCFDIMFRVGMLPLIFEDSFEPVAGSVNVSNQEKLAYLTKDLSEAQLASVVAIVEAHLAALDEAMDDAFCMRLLKEAHNNPDCAEFVSEEEALRELGIDVNVL